MAKFQVAFCLLVAFTVMLQVEAGYLYPRKEFDAEALMDDLRDMDMDDVDRYELSKRSCADDPYYAPICRMFSESHCNRKTFFTSTRNYNDFHTWCRRTCHVCF
ncbi:uncharacterized protein LOC110069270 [Orbicella faveolata]|uniref:uncharacterized protein LOC110069270 n=1 Tax=Orbicella faveolata TaxID=48498 RepID=UPI0009E43665|nr:uncharacterized protein LOC110069270 [Orbicella faveolata]